ncbi:hypothetical protein CHS0354_013891 [Potamilus streckersoni]|uniref:Ig-like domain-containing protein n=1 Tax=Potamilus streckersoni TaxID=2493646 RepID=A0AAE0VLA6_9BIVA|nr:hypothetical protein CHS0354_013891 [Potamilus streckersoni]
MNACEDLFLIKNQLIGALMRLTCTLLHVKFSGRCTPTDDNSLSASIIITMSAKAAVITMSLCLMVRESVEFIWTTSVLSTTSCEGQDKLLVWNYSVGENDRIRQLQWYYNKTTLICYNSESYGFHVTPLYEGRVEKNGTSGIILKKVLSNDTGEYALYPKLSGEKSRNVQAILLKVLELPIFDCKPTITSLSNLLISCSVTTCGKPHLSTEWKIEGEQDPVGNESYLTLKSSWAGKLLFCCPYEPRMECLNWNKFEFCTPTLTYNTHTKDDIHTENSTEVHTVNVPNTKDTNNVLQITLILCIVLLLVMTMVIGVFLVTFYFRKRRISVKTKLKNATKVKECTKEPAPHQRASEPTDGHSSSSGQNQNIQIVNNINMDSNILSSMFNSYAALNTELMALQEENRQLADRLYRYQCLPQLKDTEIT